MWRNVFTAITRCHMMLPFCYKMTAAFYVSILHPRHPQKTLYQNKFAGIQRGSNLEHFQLKKEEDQKSNYSKTFLLLEEHHVTTGDMLLSVSIDWNSMTAGEAIGLSIFLCLTIRSGQTTASENMASTVRGEKKMCVKSSKRSRLRGADTRMENIPFSLDTFKCRFTGDRQKSWSKTLIALIRVLKSQTAAVTTRRSFKKIAVYL